MSTSRAVPAINVTPLIDVLLVLLIIFMVISPLKAARFKTLVPEEPSRRQNVVANIHTLVVSLDAYGRLRLNGGGLMGSARDTSQLAVALTELFRQRREARVFRHGLADVSAIPESERIEKTVFVKAPRSLPYGEVARVIDGIKGAGAQPIGLQIDELGP